jgi:L-fuculose-phosphate aldolase
VLLERERELIAAYGRRLVEQGLVVGTQGNLSSCDGELLAITPTAVPYEEIDAESVCVVDLHGARLGGAHEPSTELPVHLAVYRARGPGAIVHAHAPFSTAVGCVGDQIPAMHHLVAEFGGPVRTAPYATPGSGRLASAALEALRGRTSALLQSHGTLTLGDSVEEAFERTVLLETVAQVYWLSSVLGDPVVLPDAEVARLVKLRNGHGRARVTSLS